DVSHWLKSQGDLGSPLYDLLGTSRGELHPLARSLWFLRVDHKIIGNAPAEIRLLFIEKSKFGAVATLPECVSEHVSIKYRPADTVPSAKTEDVRSSCAHWIEPFR